MKRGLPPLVLLVDGDNELLFDLQQPLWLETLLHLVAKLPSFQLQEFFPGAQDLVAQAPEGRFCHQLVVPFLRRDPPPAPPPLRPPLAEELARPWSRSFLPGSEWLFIKIYTGRASADHILRLALLPFINSQEANFDRWFFLRYSDPDHHLRLRFHGSPKLLMGELLPSLQEILTPFQRTGCIWRIQVDTYEREVARYGGAHAILLAEEMFWHDSRAVLDLVQAYPGHAGASWRWRLGLLAVDWLLNDMGFDLVTKGRLIGGSRNSLGQSFLAQQGLESQLADKFRLLRRELEGLVFGTETGPQAEPGLAVLTNRSWAWRDCMEGLGQAEVNGRLGRTRGELAESHAHMHLNRLLRSAQVAHEFVIYDLLDRLYQSRLARSRAIAT